MTTVFEVDTIFVESQEISLNADDLRMGFDRGFISAATVVDLATTEVRRGNSDAAILALACLLRSQLDQVPFILSAFDDPQRNVELRSLRKWLYLQLRAAFERRESLSDPFDVVEQIYSAFGYPPSVAPFVRYMPAPLGATIGEDVMLERWHEFLDNEHSTLRR